MNLFITFRVAFRALTRNKLRTLLAMLGIVIGVAAVVTLVAVGQGARQAVEDQLGSLGRDLLFVMPGSRTSGGARGGYGSKSTLSAEDSEAIAAECGAVIATSPVVRSSGQVVWINHNWNTSVQGVGADFALIRAWPVAKGDFFSREMVQSGQMVCVLGKVVAEEIFGSLDPIGEIVRVKKRPFVVIGVMSEKGQAAMMGDQDDAVLIPYTVVQRRFTGSRTVNAISASAESEALVPVAQAQIESLLRRRHRTLEGAGDDFVVRNMAEIAAAAGATAEIMTLLLGSIAGISLLVGGIGIMNIMLVSVTERTREIGIRMAIGARPRDIRWQFLMEALVIGAVGGGIGVGIGLLAGVLIPMYAGWQALVTTESIALAFGFSVTVGVVFGFYPAMKASRLDPIEALRYE